jgi:hypothetical protein
MKKQLLIIINLLIFPAISWASQINLNIDKTQLSTDETLQINLSVDGVLDNGQIGLQGLENFTILGQTSSQQIQIINGSTTAIQEKIITLQPNKSGEFTIQAVGKENGKEIKSSAFTIKVNKSLVQETKEKLLNSIPSTTSKNEKKTVKTNNLSTQSIKKTPITPIEQLQIKELSKFPPVQHYSAFNKIFWIEFLGILILLGLNFYGIWYFKQKISK